MNNKQININELSLNQLLNLGIETPDIRPFFFERLLDSEVFILINLMKLKDLKDGDKIEPNTNVDIVTFSKDDLAFIPFFTTEDSLNIAYETQFKDTSNPPAFTKLPFHMLLNSVKDVSMVMDLFYPVNKMFSIEELDFLRENSTPENLQIYPYEDKNNNGTIQILTNFFKEREEVNVAYISLVQKTMFHQPNTLVVIDVFKNGVDDNEVFDTLFKDLNNHLSELNLKEQIVFLKYQFDSNICMSVVESQTPFYNK